VTARPRRPGGRSKVTLKEVARQAGVSAMTVSNVINGKEARVGAKTREKVEATIARLGYRPDLAGRSLRLSRQFLVEMIIVDPSPAFVADAFTTSILAGLSNCLNRRDYGLIVRGTTSERLSKAGGLRSRQTDAICVMASGPAKLRNKVYRLLAAHDDPCLVFQDSLPADIKDAASVMQDDAGGGAMLAEHLLARGCRRFVWVTGQHPWPALERREAAVRKRLEAKGAGASLQVIRARGLDYSGLQASIATHIAREGAPDAFICGNDQIGIAVVNWLVDNGYRVPEQVRVTGFNAFDFWRYARPALTTVESPAYELGELGGNMLIERLRDGAFEKRSVVLPVALRVGQSS
jgi:LacI family transcriptional regulator